METTPPPRRRKMRWKPVLGWLALLVVLGLVVAAVVARQILVKPAEVNQAVAPMIVTVERGDLNDLVQVNGALEPREQIRVSFPDGARVSEVLVKRGDVVAAGAVLARLETYDLELKVASAKAEVDQAQQALTKLEAGPTQADLAMAAAKVARTRAELLAANQSVRRIDIDVAKARLDLARQRLAELESGQLTDDLNTSQKGIATAEDALTEARRSLEQTRDTSSRAKTDAQQALERGSQELEKVQRAYSDAWWDWDYVQRTGRHPTEKAPAQEGKPAENRELTPREIEAFRRTLADAETNLHNAEVTVKNLSEAYDQARENEIRQIETSQRNVAAAERNVADARRSYDTARGRGLQTAITEARQAVAEAEKTYKGLVDNPERPARKAELEAAVLEAVAAEKKLRSGPDPVEKAKARTALEQARASLATAERNLNAATLKAPLAGTVVDITLKPGTLTTNTDAVRIADLRSFLIRGQVTEQNVARLKAGMGVEIAIDSVSDETFRGELTLVSALPSNQGDGSQSQGGGNNANALGGIYPVEIVMKASDPRLRVGMATSAKIEVFALKNVLSIPLQAVEYSDTGDATVQRESGEKVPIKLGVTSGDRVQVLSGLNEGDKLTMPLIPTAPTNPAIPNAPPDALGVSNP